MVRSIDNIVKKSKLNKSIRGVPRTSTPTPAID